MMRAELRALWLLPLVIAAPALLLLATRPSKYAPTPLLLAVAVVAGLVGFVSWWRNHGPPRKTRVAKEAAARIERTARMALEDHARKRRDRLSEEEVIELGIFYERWLNLDAEERGTFREELASEGINMIRLGEALRFLHEG